MSERETWYFTFGASHPYANRFYVVRDATAEEARERMFATFGRKWGFQYDESQWVRDGVSQAERYGLLPVHVYVMRTMRPSPVGEARDDD